MSQTKKLYLNLVRHVRSPSPDSKSKNVIARTTIQTNTIKKYLQTIKRHHNLITNDTQPSLQQDQDSQSEVIDHLKQRIRELEEENVDYKEQFQQYEQLVQKNKALEDQMLLLLEELQNRDNQQYLTNREMNSNQDNSKQRYLTTVESSSKNISKEKNNEYSLVNEIKPFETINIQTHLEKYSGKQPFSHEQTQKIKKIVEQQVRQAIEQLQIKFIKQMKEMQAKISSIMISNQQALKYRLNDQSSSSNKSSQQYVGKTDKKQQFESLSYREPSFQTNRVGSEKHLQSDSNYLSVIPYPSSKLKNSTVQIQMDNLSDSNHSFGKSARKHQEFHFNATPQGYFFQEKDYRQNQSQPPIHSKLIDVVRQRINENISGLRSNLTYLFGQVSKESEPYLKQIEIDICKQLKSIFVIFFPHETVNKDAQNSVLYSPTVPFNINFSGSKIQESSGKQAAQKYLLNSYYNSIRQANNSEGFEQTGRKLKQILQIIKKFNESYKHLLQDNAIKTLQEKILKY